MATAAIDQIFVAALEGARVRPVRKLREWAESEVVIPDGPYKGERFRVRRQPFAGLLFDELDSGRWPETFVVGPSQTGKTLIGHVIPPLHAAAELRRNVVIATPDMRMGSNKWEIDFRPVLDASPDLRRLVPVSGPGSRGGTIKDSVRLTNGAVVKWMTANGDDTQRAGFTAEGGVYCTEAARFSQASETSVEADPLDQLRARMQALPRRRRRLIVEGTCTVDRELPWAAREQSSQSRIVLPCPHCDAWVTLEREHLAGWEEARSEHEAAELAHYRCPACATRWTEAERAAANRDGRLLHAGQSIERGEVVGEFPATERLWFRWTMGNNLLLSAGDVAVDEWKAKQLSEGTDEHDNAERKLCQFVWARVYTPSNSEHEPLSSHRVARHQDTLPRGLAPADTEWVTVGVDLGKWMGHFVAVAWRKDGLSSVIDYGIFDVPTKRNDTDEAGFDELVAIGKALDTLRERFETYGWTKHGSGEVLLADKVLVDLGYQDDAVKDFVRRWSADGRFGRASEAYVACKGAGTGQHDTRRYSHPTRRSSQVIAIGKRYYVTRHMPERYDVIDIDTNHWKSWVHERLRSPLGSSGSMTLFAGTEKEHNTFAKHITNESLEQKPVPGFGMVTVWTNHSHKPNHYFDSLVYACVAGHMVGFRVIPSQLAPESSAQKSTDATDDSELKMPDGRNFYDLPI